MALVACSLGFGPRGLGFCSGFGLTTVALVLALRDCGLTDVAWDLTLGVWGLPLGVWSLTLVAWGLSLEVWGLTLEVCELTIGATILY